MLIPGNWNGQWKRCAMSWEVHLFRWRSSVTSLSWSSALPAEQRFVLKTKCAISVAIAKLLLGNRSCIGSSRAARKYAVAKTFHTIVLISAQWCSSTNVTWSAERTADKYHLAAPGFLVTLKLVSQNKRKLFYWILHLSQISASYPIIILGLYCNASARCADWISSLPAKSAMVRESFKIRW